MQPVLRAVNPVIDTDMSPPARKIIELNIRHFRRLLETEKDPDKRATIERLLAEHEETLIRLGKKETD